MSEAGKSEKQLNLEIRKARMAGPAFGAGLAFIVGLAAMFLFSGTGLESLAIVILIGASVYGIVLLVQFAAINSEIAAAQSAHKKQIEKKKEQDAIKHEKMRQDAEKRKQDEAERQKRQQAIAAQLAETERRKKEEQAEAEAKRKQRLKTFDDDLDEAAG